MITSSSKPKVIAVVGPTASGKTAYAVDLAHKVGGEIVSADSRLVYRGLDIGTAKPDNIERRGIPHHMIDIADLEDEYSAGLYAKDAESAIYDILSRGKVPIIAGGTGLYINVLLKNYELPKVDADKKLRDELNALDNEALHTKLYKLDPVTAQNIDVNDKKRVIRALEVVITLGKQLSETRGYGDAKFDVEWVGLNYERSELYKRINSRVDSMIDAGLIEETKKLLCEHGRVNNLVYTIGYQEIISYLDGELTLAEAVDKLKQNTRRFAKRQLTWFRKNSDINWNIYPQRL